MLRMNIRKTAFPALCIKPVKTRVTNVQCINLSSRWDLEKNTLASKGNSSPLGSVFGVKCFFVILCEKKRDENLELST